MDKQVSPVLTHQASTRRRRKTTPERIKNNYWGSLLLRGSLQDPPSHASPFRLSFTLSSLSLLPFISRRLTLLRISKKTKFAPFVNLFQNQYNSKRQLEACKVVRPWPSRSRSSYKEDGGGGNWAQCGVLGTHQWRLWASRRSTGCGQRRRTRENGTF